MADIFVGDTPILERVITDQDGAIVDVSTASLKQIILGRPNGGGSLTKTATFTTNGVDGKIRYQIVSELDVPGIWQWEGYVEIGIQKYHTDFLEFEVKEHL